MNQMMVYVYLPCPLGPPALLFVSCAHALHCLLPDARQLALLAAD